MDKQTNTHTNKLISNFSMISSVSVSVLRLHGPFGSLPHVLRCPGCNMIDKLATFQKNEKSLVNTCKTLIRTDSVQRENMIQAVITLQHGWSTDVSRNQISNGHSFLTL